MGNGHAFHQGYLFGLKQWLGVVFKELICYTNRIGGYPSLDL
jgi:hypothetical protein